MFPLLVKFTGALTRFCGSIFVFFVSIALVRQLSAQESPEGTSVNPIIGTWKGIYFEFPELVTVRLIITSLPMDYIEGECELSPAVEPYFHNSGTHNHYSVKGIYTPWATEFSIKPDKAIGPQSGAMPELGGVYDPASDQIVGEVNPTRSGNRVYFLLGRDDRGDKVTADIVASANPLVQGGGNNRVRGMAPLPAGPVSLKFRPPTADTIAAWASRLRTEKPDIDLQHTYINILYLLAHNLFEDNYFRKFFGDTYDKLNSNQRETFLKIFRDPKSRQTLINCRFLSGAFSPTGSNSSSDITMTVFWQRAMRSWMGDRITRFEKMPATSETLTLLKSFESLGATELKTLWPSDQAEFNKAIGETRSRVTTVVLNRGLDDVMAKATDLAGARNLAVWVASPQQGELFKYTPKELKDEIAAKIDHRIDELIEQPLNEKIKAIAALGQGIDAVTNGNSWYNALMQEFGFASARPAFQHALKQLQDRREGDLVGASATIAAQVTAQTSISAAHDKLAGYLRVPGDDQTKAAAALRAAREKRVAEIKANEYLEYFSSDERKWSPQRDGTITQPPVVPPPDEEDIRFAVVRTLAMLNSADRTGPSSVRLYLNPLAKMADSGVTITVLGVNSLSCHADNGGYICSYRLKSKNEASSALVSRNDPLQGLMNGLSAIADLPQQVSEERFELGRRGWWSPGLMERIRKGAQEYNQELESQ